MSGNGASKRELPKLTPLVVRGLRSMRSLADITLDSDGDLDERQIAELQAGIRYIDALLENAPRGGRNGSSK